MQWPPHGCVHSPILFNLHIYCQHSQRWHLKLTATETVNSTFHLLVTSATQELSVYVDNQPVKHDRYQTYLGMTLDRTLSYRELLKTTTFLTHT